MFALYFINSCRIRCPQRSSSVHLHDDWSGQLNQRLEAELVGSQSVWATFEYGIRESPPGNFKQP